MLCGEVCVTLSLGSELMVDHITTLMTCVHVYIYIYTSSLASQPLLARETSIPLDCMKITVGKTFP